MRIAIRILLGLVILIFIGVSCSVDEQVLHLEYRDDEAVPDGIGNEKVWSTVNTFSSFIYPWNDKPVPDTQFKAFHDSDYIYFCFEVLDEEIILKQSGDEEMDAVASDRVEIFIRSRDASKPYYSFEMDPLGRVFDSKAEFGKYIDQEYDYPADGLTFSGNVDKLVNRYSVEGKLSISTLSALDLIAADNSIMMGLYRGEYFTNDQGDEETHWISWVRPDSETPNFHIPSSFGKVILENLNK